VAAAAGGHVTHQIGLVRANAKQLEQTLGQEMLQQVFGAKLNTPFVAGSGPLQGLVVARIDAIHAADPKDIAPMIDPLRQRADQTYLQGIAGAARAAALKMIKPTTDVTLADNVMGVTPEMQAKLHPKTPAKGAALIK
jgi:peptidyl-prolyl cis-trans isomerase D